MLRSFSNERGWGRFHDPKNLAMLLASEAGELIAELRWIDTAGVDAYVEDPTIKARIAEEVADVLIAALLFSDRINLDVRDAIARKIEKNRANYPVESSHGVSNRSPVITRVERDK